MTEYVPLDEVQEEVIVKLIVSPPETIVPTVLFPETVPDILPLDRQGDPVIDTVPLTDEPL